MFTRKTYKFLGHHYIFSRIFSALPFRWDTEMEMLTCVTNKIEILWWYLNNIASVAITACIIRCFVLGLFNGGRSIALLAMDAMYIMPYAAQVFFFFHLVIDREEMAELLNALLAFDKRYTAHHCIKPERRESASEEEKEPVKQKTKKEKEPTDNVDANLFLSTYMMFVYGALSTSVFLKHPEDPRYLYGFLPSPWEGEKPWWMVYTWAFVEYFQLIRFCCTFNNVFDVIMMYARCVNFWLYELSRPGIKADEKRTITVPVRRSDVILNYKAQIVLNNLFNGCCSSIVLPTFQCLNMGLHIVAMYVSLMFYHDIPISGFLIFPIGFTMWCAIEKDTYPLLGQIEDLSRSYKISWKSELGRESKRNLRALKDLGVQVSAVYTVGKDTILTVWSNILGQVINLILL